MNCINAPDIINWDIPNQFQLIVWVGGVQQQQQMEVENQGVEEQFYVSPIANPLAGDKLRAKILKLAKALNQEKRLRRGVKEVVKAIRKGAVGICILAADVNPVDVYSHIPIICEQKGIPYVYVRSRMELGAAAQTKKPTSVVLMVEPTDENLQQKFNSLSSKLLGQNTFA